MELCVLGEGGGRRGRGATGKAANDHFNNLISSHNKYIISLNTTHAKPFGRGLRAVELWGGGGE